LGDDSVFANPAKPWDVSDKDDKRFYAQRCTGWVWRILEKLSLALRGTTSRLRAEFDGVQFRTDSVAMNSCFDSSDALTVAAFIAVVKPNSAWTLQDNLTHDSVQYRICYQLYEEIVRQRATLWVQARLAVDYGYDTKHRSPRCDPADVPR
jgi:hypothetical protein